MLFVFIVTKCKKEKEIAGRVLQDTADGCKVFYEV